MIDIDFSYLFSVEVLHEYFKHLQCRDIAICPTADTADVMNGYRMICKTNGNLLRIGMQGTTTISPNPLPQQGFTPLILPAVGTQLTFYVYNSNPLFFNFTEIPLSSLNKNSIFYFTNRNINENSAKETFLTIPLGDALPAGLGGLYINPADDTVYQSLVANNTTAPTIPLNYSLWRKAHTNRYATAADTIDFLPMVSIFSLPATWLNVTSVKITLKGYTPLPFPIPVPVPGISYETIIINNAAITFPYPPSEFQIDLPALARGTALTPGKYVLLVTAYTADPIITYSSTQTIYLDEGLSNTQGLLGVIDIYLDAIMPVDYELLDSNNFLKSPQYMVCFLNRATYWNYNLSPESPGGAISDNHHNYTFNGSLESQMPIPFSEKPHHNFSITMTGSGTINHYISCASPENLSTATNPPFYNSEIYLNY